MFEIPEDWKITKLESSSMDIHYGITAKAVKNSTKFKLLRTTDIKNYKVDWNSLPYCEITEKRENLERYKVRTGDIIVTRSGTVGISALAEKDFNNVVFGSYLIRVKLNTEKVFPKFIHQFMQSNLYWNQISTASAGSTLRNIKLPTLKNLKIPLPSLHEQRKIAHVLTTIDKAIEEVDKAIKKAEKIKKGLMQELLTKGIGHKEFKDTEIGRIPKEWKVVKLGEIAKLESGGTPSRQKLEYWKRGTIPWIKSGELNDILIYDSEEKITELGLKNSSAKIFPKGTLLIALYGATVGKTGILSIEASTNQAVCAILPAFPNTFDSKFLQYCLILLREKLIAQSSGGAQSNIYLYVLKNFKIPLPPLEEQKKISEILSKWDRVIDLKKAKKEKLERMKKKVMELLLTGKVRIK